MPKRKVFSGESCCDLLRTHGFVAVRQRGSHRVMQKKEGPIIRQSHLDRSLFES